MPMELVRRPRSARSNIRDVQQEVRRAYGGL